MAKPSECCCTPCCSGEEVKIGSYTFTRVVLGYCTGYLYNLKSPSPIKCSGCNHSIFTTDHICKLSDLFQPGDWINSKSNVYRVIREENFKTILNTMLSSGLLVLCDRVESHLMKNIFTTSPAEESHRLEPGDKIILPPVTCNSGCHASDFHISYL